MQTKHYRASWQTTIVLTAVCTLSAADPSPIGRWKTVDDKTGQARGIVRIYEEHGTLFGKIEASLKASESKEHCDLCTDDRKGHPVIGLVVIRGLKKQGDEYSGGDILEPDTGTIYRCKLRLLDQGKKLLVRGYLVIPLIGRTQTWIREP